MSQAIGADMILIKNKFHRSYAFMGVELSDEIIIQGILISSMLDIL